MKVIEKRVNLKGTNIVISDDLTERERKILKIKNKAAEAMKAERNKKIKIGYGKIKIGDKWFLL